MRDLMAEYIAGAEDLHSFYAAPPSALFDCAPSAAPWDASVVEAIKAYQTELGATAVFEGNEAAIITGQQPGIFTGPLYTIYKAITAIQLADTLQERFGTRCVPVFWVGSEDHDFEEARSTHFLTKNHRPLTVVYDPPEDVDGLPMYRVPADGTLHALIDEAAEETFGSEFREDVAGFLHESLSAATSLADWTARLVARLFRDTPLIIFSPHLPAARAAGRAILEKEIREPLTSTRLLNRQGERLDAAEFPPQLIKGANECGFFLKVNERRRKVLFEKGRFILPDESITHTEAELLAILAESPERFSPNVALRCIVQQHLFPVAAYVAGPGEIAYWAQLKPVFEHFGESMPIVYPRAKCTLTTMKLNKIRSKLGLELSDLVKRPEELLREATKNTTENEAYTFTRAHRDVVEATLQDLTEGLRARDKTAAAIAEGLGKDVSMRLDRLEKKILQQDIQKNDALGKQIARLCNSLAPDRKPQERYYNIFSFLFEHGWDLIPRLIEEIDAESFELQEIEL